MMTDKQLGEELKIAADNLARAVHKEVDDDYNVQTCYETIVVCRYFIENRKDPKVQQFWLDFRRNWESSPRTDAGVAGQ